jgi:hypothetical protein
VFRVARPAPGVAADRRAVYIDILGFSVRVPVTTGVSAIACWQPTRKSRLWFGLRLISKRSVPWSTGSRINEESQVPKQELSTVGKSSSREHHPLWFLYNQVGETLPST